jgi:hypothetical protein
MFFFRKEQFSCMGENIGLKKQTSKRGNQADSLQNVNKKHPYAFFHSFYLMNRLVNSFSSLFFQAKTFSHT